MAGRENSGADKLFRANYGYFLRYLTKKLGNADEAEDVLQESFAQYHKIYGDDADIAYPNSLFLKIASNIAIDRARQRTARERRESEWSETQGEEKGFPAAEPPNQLRALEARDEIERIKKHLLELSPKVAASFALHKFHGLSHRQIAARLGISKSTVEKHIIKAMKHVMKEMDEQ